MNILKSFLLTCLVVATLSGCKGVATLLSDVGNDSEGEETNTGDDTTGGDGEVQLSDSSVGFSIPSQLVLVGNTDQESSSSLSFHGAMSFLASATESATIDDDFTNDESKEYIYDGMSDYLSTINQMFCALGQTQMNSDAVMNQGPVIVLVDTAKCAPDYYFSTTGSAPSVAFEEYLLNAFTNEDGTATVYFKVNGNTNQMGSLGFWYETIDGQINITEGVSAENQIGIFDLFATGYYQDVAIFNSAFSSVARDDGMIELLNSVEYPSDNYSFSTTVHAVLDPQGASGSSLVTYSSVYDDPLDEMPEQRWDTTVNLNYDENFVSSVMASEGWNYEQCMDRHAKSETYVSYNLYEQNSENSEKYDRKDLLTYLSFKTESGLWGSASPWGTYAGEELVDGQVVHAEDGLDYTIDVGGGQLSAQISTEYNMNLLDNKDIYAYDYTTFESFIKSYDADTFTFYKTKVYSCSEDYTRCGYETLAEPEALALSIGTFSEYASGLGLVNYAVTEEGFNADSTFVMTSYEYLNPTDVSGTIELKCFYNCPKGGLTQDDITNFTYYYSDEGPHYYTLDESFNLTESEDGLVSTSGLDLAGSWIEWGFASGPMVLADSLIDNSSQIFSADTVYTYQVGVNAWTRYTGLLDSEGAPVQFDSYLNCTYENDEGTYMLQYYDQGQLYGIPYVEVPNEETGFSTYAAQFRIADGDTMTCDDGQTYKTKAVYVQYQLDAVSNSNCDTLSANSLSEASIEFVTPELPDMTPTTEVPVVIGGVVQD